MIHDKELEKNADSLRAAAESVYSGKFIRRVNIHMYLPKFGDP